MSVLGSIGTLLSRMPVSEWIALAASATTIINDAIKLGEDLTPVLKKLGDTAAAMQRNDSLGVENMAKAHQQWTSAWTAADQRAAEFQSEGR